MIEAECKDMNTKKRLMSKEPGFKGTRICIDNDRTWIEQRSRNKVVQKARVDV